MPRPALPDPIHLLLEQAKEAALGTLEAGGPPFVSACGCLYDEENGKVLLLLSDLARHTRNLRERPAVSLLILEPGTGTPVHEKKRLTVLGEAASVTQPERVSILRKQYLEKYPGAAVFLQLSDFRFYAVTIREIHWVAGFGNAGAWKRES